MDMAGHGALGGVFALADFVLFWVGQREKRVSLLCCKYLTGTAKGSLYLEKWPGEVDYWQSPLNVCIVSV